MRVRTAAILCLIPIGLSCQIIRGIHDDNANITVRVTDGRGLLQAGWTVSAVDDATQGTVAYSAQVRGMTISNLVLGRKYRIHLRRPTQHEIVRELYIINKQTVDVVALNTSNPADGTGPPPEWAGQFVPTPVQAGQFVWITLWPAYGGQDFLSVAPGESTILRKDSSFVVNLSATRAGSYVYALYRDSGIIATGVLNVKLNQDQPEVLAFSEPNHR